VLAATFTETQDACLQPLGQRRFLLGVPLTVALKAHNVFAVQVFGELVGFVGEILVGQVEQPSVSVSESGYLRDPDRFEP
jgi:hypothetical protein